MEVFLLNQYASPKANHSKDKIVDFEDGEACALIEGGYARIPTAADRALRLKKDRAANRALDVDELAIAFFELADRVAALETRGGTR